MTLRVLHKVGIQKVSCIYDHYFPSDLYKTTFQALQ